MKIYIVMRQDDVQSLVATQFPSADGGGGGGGRGYCQCSITANNANGKGLPLAARTVSTIITKLVSSALFTKQLQASDVY